MNYKKKKTTRNQPTKQKNPNQKPKPKPKKPQHPTNQPTEKHQNQAKTTHRKRVGRGRSIQLTNQQFGNKEMKYNN